MICLYRTSSHRLLPALVLVPESVGGLRPDPIPSASTQVGNPSPPP